MKHIAFVSVARSDYNYLKPVFQELLPSQAVKPLWIAGGAHLSQQHGGTSYLFAQDGFEIEQAVSYLLPKTDSASVAASAGIAVQKFSDAFLKSAPDAVVLLGDRFDTLSAAMAAALLKIPIIHLHGGEETQGAYDNNFRHAISKLATYHFVARQEFADRLVKMGEAPDRVFVSGAPAIDLLNTVPELPRGEWVKQVESLAIGIGPSADLNADFLLATFHPETLANQSAHQMAEEFFRALNTSKRTILLTMPNADTDADIIRQQANQMVNNMPLVLVENLGATLYYNACRFAMAMVGNSSSGILEAASFKLPVVNIGNRQGGRPQSENVINCVCETEAIVDAINQAVTPEFRAQSESVVNPYGDGRSAPRIARQIAELSFDPRVLLKSVEFNS